MTTAIDAATFEPVELDLLATHAGVPFPFPLRVPSFGRVAAERDALLAEAGRALAARDLADAHGPLGAAADVVTALREHRGAVDLVVIGADTVTGTLALVYRSSALLCGQRLDGERPGAVTVRRIEETALADELTGLVPDVAPAPTLPINLPPGVVADVLALLDRDGDNEPAHARVRDLIRDRGGDQDVFEALTGLLPTVTGRGQLGATRRVGATSTRAGAELSWLDGPAGRVRVGHADRGWTSVNSLRRTEFRLAVNDAAGIARKPWGSRG